jgi:hypothetical protein
VYFYLYTMTLLRKMSEYNFSKFLRDYEHQNNLMPEIQNRFSWFFQITMLDQYHTVPGASTFHETQHRSHDVMRLLLSVTPLAKWFPHCRRGGQQTHDVKPSYGLSMRLVSVSDAYWTASTACHPYWSQISSQVITLRK